MSNEIELGKLVQVENIVLEFGENKGGYVGGYVEVDGVIRRVIFTPRELALGITRADKEQENFAKLQRKVSFWEKFKAWFE